MSEGQIHDQFVAWLRKLDIPFIHHRMDKKSGIKSGWPDFTVLWMSRAVCIEVKTAKGRISVEQARVMQFIRRSGNKVEICRSCEECIEAVKNILCEGKLVDQLEPHQARPAFTEEFSKLKHVVEQVPGGGKTLPPFAIAHWNGTPYVMAKSPTKEGYEMIRKASAIDMANFPKIAA